LVSNELFLAKIRDKDQTNLKKLFFAINKLQEIKKNEFE